MSIQRQPVSICDAILEAAARFAALFALGAILLATSACSEAEVAGTGKGDANRVLMEKLLTAFNTGDLTVLDEIVDPGFSSHTSGGLAIAPGPSGPQAFYGVIGMLRTAMPDLNVVPEAIVAEGDQIVLYAKAMGTNTGSYMGFPPTGGPLAIDSVDIFRVANGKLVEQRNLTDKVGLFQQLTFPMPAPAPMEPLPAEVMMTFEPGEFMESVKSDSKGNIYVTSMLRSEITKLTPAGERSLFAALPTVRPDGLPGLLCIDFDKDDNMYATVHSPDPSKHGIWRIDADGNGEPFAPMPPFSVPNGLDIDEHGNIYVADSIPGAVWKIKAGTNKAEIWLKHPYVAQRPFIGQFPGPNGVRLSKGYLYVAVSDQALFVRVPIKKDGSAGTPEIVATGVPGDDFDIDAEGNAYLTTHPFNTVIKVRPDGSRAVVGSVPEGIVGPTAAAFGRAEGDRDSLYVISDGGVFAPLPDRPLTPNLVRLKTGIKGQ